MQNIRGTAFLKDSDAMMTEHDWPNNSLFHFSVYIDQGRYKTHNIILNGPSVCRLCE